MVLHISRRGDERLRALLYEAATVILTRVRAASALRSWALALKKRLGFKRAAVAADAGAEITVPDDLEAQVRDFLAENPEVPWEDGVRHAAENVTGLRATPAAPISRSRRAPRR